MTLSDISNTPSKKRKELDSFTRGVICGLATIAKWKQVDIAKELEIPTSTVNDIVRKYRETGQKECKQRPGRPEVLTERDISHLVISVRKEPFEPLAYHQQILALAGKAVCLKTIRKALASRSLYSFKPALKPFLSKRNITRRKFLVYNKLKWGDEDWRKVIWSDESRFTLRHNDGGARVFRKIGERLKKRFVLPTFKFGKGSVMVWGCFWAGGLGPLVTMTGDINQDKYVQCLSDHYVPWIKNMKEQYGHDFIFQEDGASCHTGSYARWWKDQVGIKGFEYWPAQSPDLNPIENLWYILGKRIGKRRSQCNNLKELEAIIHEE